MRVNFAEYCLKYGFLPKYLGIRVFHLGIDARYLSSDINYFYFHSHTRSVLLDGYSAAGLTHGRYQHHSTVDSSLTQLFTFLSQLSIAPAHCTFVFDGKDRPAHKRGIQVIKTSPLLYNKSKLLIKAFGFDIRNVHVVHLTLYA